MLKQIKTLQGFENVKDYYYISENGEVYSAKIKRFANIGDNGHGYKRIGLKLEGERKWKNAYIHRLVALAYIENPENKNEVNHIDEDKSNNNVDNLEWCTRKENINHGTCIEKQKASKSEKTFVFMYDGSFVDSYTSLSIASKTVLGHRNTRSNKRVKEYVFMNGKPTYEKFMEILESSPYKSIKMINKETNESKIFPSQKSLQKHLKRNINLTDYIKKGHLFDGRFKFELYQPDRIDMPNLHE